MLLTPLSSSSSICTPSLKARTSHVQPTPTPSAWPPLDDSSSHLGSAEPWTLWRSCGDFGIMSSRVGYRLYASAHNENRGQRLRITDTRLDAQKSLIVASQLSPLNEHSTRSSSGYSDSGTSIRLRTARGYRVSMSTHIDYIDA